MPRPYSCVSCHTIRGNWAEQDGSLHLQCRGQGVHGRAPWFLTCSRRHAPRSPSLSTRVCESQRGVRTAFFERTMLRDLHLTDRDLFPISLPVKVGRRRKTLHGYIDRSGAVVIPPQFTMAGAYFTEGKTFASPRKKYGYIDRTGRFVIPETFTSASFFSEGMASVEIRRDVAGYINHDGQVVIPCKYWVAGSFSEGMAAVLPGGLWGYIDTGGQMVIPPQFKRTRGFSEGLAAVVWPGGGWSYIDRTGQVAIRGPFEGDVAGDYDAEGNVTSITEHAVNDPFRYRFMPAGWKALNPMNPTWRQQWNRIPYLLKGAAAGAGFGGASAMAGRNCGCP